MLSSEKLQCTACGNVETCNNALTGLSLMCNQYVPTAQRDVDTSLIKPWVKPAMYLTPKGVSKAAQRAAEGLPPR
jgi:hypothetical protein